MTDRPGARLLAKLLERGADASVTQDNFESFRAIIDGEPLCFLHGSGSA